MPRAAPARAPAESDPWLQVTENSLIVRRRWILIRIGREQLPNGPVFGIPRIASYYQKAQLLLIAILRAAYRRARRRRQRILEQTVDRSLAIHGHETSAHLTGIAADELDRMFCLSVVERAMP